MRRDSVSAARGISIPGSATVHRQCLAPGKPLIECIARSSQSLAWQKTTMSILACKPDWSEIVPTCIYSMHDQASVMLQGANLRCNRRVTIARDHIQQGASAAPAGMSKRRKAAAGEAEPLSALHAAAPPGGVELHLDDIMAAEVRRRGITLCSESLPSVMRRHWQRGHEEVQRSRIAPAATAAASLTAQTCISLIFQRSGCASISA